MLIFLTLHLPTLANTPVQATEAQLRTAQAAAAAHRDAAAFAKARVRADAAQAALLAEQQVAAAARVRRLENQTGGAADLLARLQAESVAEGTVLKAGEAGLAALLPIMQRLTAAPAATILATPKSPVDSVRGILVLQGIAGEIERRSAAVKAQAAVVAGLMGQISAQQKVLLVAVAAEQRAEDLLTMEIDAARKAEMADSDTAIGEAAAALKADEAVHDLRGMIARLQAPPALPSPPPPPSAAVVMAGAGAPVSGMMVENYGDPTIAGPAQGVTYRAAPGARVVAPCAGPVLFADAFRSYGLLVILGCGTNTDFVLSGMSRLDVSAGEKIARGQPIGEMAGFDDKNPVAKPHLYVELLQNGAPASPAAWLVSGGA